MNMCKYCKVIECIGEHVFCSTSCGAKWRHAYQKENFPVEYRERQRRVALIGGRNSAISRKKNKVGIFFDIELQRKMGKRGGARSKELKKGYCDPKVQRRANEIQRIKKTGFFNSKQQSEQGKKGGAKTVEILRKQSRHSWMGVKFRSKMEMECAKKILAKPVNLVNCNIRVGTKTFDFYPKADDKRFKNQFVEFHPILIFFRPNETKESYYDDRRKILDENNYQNTELIVINSLEDI